MVVHQGTDDFGEKGRTGQELRDLLQPSDLAVLYPATEIATAEFNTLEEAFEAAGSEVETVAREVIAEDFWFVASAYGFANSETAH
ncbi:DUF5713 family protein [Nonomuraea sp. NPDC050022]|uniref:DUF5713 family protein n=1 Tax=unclassified Nonomuraea TaxID=2593643 RepID=UPI0033DBA2F2